MTATRYLVMRCLRGGPQSSRAARAVAIPCRSATISVGSACRAGPLGRQPPGPARQAGATAADELAMNTKVFNLALLIFWVLLAVGLWTRELWMPPGLLERANGPQTPLAIALACMLAVWNFVRLWVAMRFAKPTG